MNDPRLTNYVLTVKRLTEKTKEIDSAFVPAAMGPFLVTLRKAIPRISVEHESFPELMNQLWRIEDCIDFLKIELKKVAKGGKAP